MEWVTKKENQIHASHTLNKRLGGNCYNSKLTDDEVVEIYNLCKDTTLTYKQIAEMYNVSSDTPAQIALGKTWEYLELEPIRRKDKSIIGINVQNGYILEYKSVRFTKSDGFSPSVISRCCAGKSKSGIHKGYKWIYK